MAGTDRTRRSAAGTPAPVVVLVEPQLGENIGAAARAMLNFGLTGLRLVRPRGEWPNYKALNTASGAESVLERAALFDTAAAAVADLQYLLAATARARDMTKPTVTPREAARHLRRAVEQGRRTGVLFGPERAGLRNEDVVRADATMLIPANPAYSSLNLAQAVLLTGYEWFQAGADEPQAAKSYRKGAKPATKAELQAFFDHLEGELDACGFLYPPDRRPHMVRSIRNIFARAALTDRELRTLRGIVAGLAARGRDR